MKKTRITAYVLLLLLSSSLFATLSIKPVQAIEPLYDIFSLKEYKQWSTYSPDYTFSKPSSSVLEMMGTTSGNGVAYAFMHIDKDQLQGNKLRIYWRWYVDYSGPSYTLADLFVVDNVHNRKLENSGEFRTYNNLEHPVVDYNYISACSLTANSNGGWISWTTSTSGVLNLAGWGDEVSIMIKSLDAWIANSVGLQVDYLQILDSSNNVLKQYDFSGDVFMDTTGGYYDYGLLRVPSSVIYGTTDYEGMGAPAGEVELSEAVADYVFSQFYDTYKYYDIRNYWGQFTLPSAVYDTAEYMEQNYDFSAVFYKGHICFFGAGGCGQGGCGLEHWGIWGYDSSWDIADFGIDDAVIGAINDNNKFAGTHDFVFIWACGHGSEPYVGVFNPIHSSGLLSSWMHLSPSTLDDDAYHGAPDYSDHVFIGFENSSIWYKDPAPEDSRFNYGHWAALFYQYLLEGGLTVKDALDQATIVTHDTLYYEDCQLDDGYWAYDPITQQYIQSRMRVWGDSSYRLPR